MATEYEAHYYFRREYLGFGHVPLQGTRELLHPPFSYTYVCPKCGEAWGHVAVLPETQFIPLARKCDRHGGGALLPWDSIYSQDVPQAVLAHELQMAEHIYHYDTFLLTGGQ